MSISDWWFHTEIRQAAGGTLCGGIRCSFSNSCLGRNTRVRGMDWTRIHAASAEQRGFPACPSFRHWICSCPSTGFLPFSEQGPR